MERLFRCDLQRFADDGDAGGVGGQGDNAVADTGGQQPEQGSEQQQVVEDVVSRSEYERLQRELEQARQSLADVQRQLMDPRYLQWLAQQSLGAQQSAPAPSVTPESEPEDEDVDFGQMDPKQLARWVANRVKREVLAAVQPQLQTVAQNAEAAKAQIEIQQAAAKYPDFWLYRDAMIRVAREYEERGVRLSAEDIYHIAKGRTGATAAKPQPRPVAPPQRPRPSPPATERPGVPSTAANKTTPPSFEEAFEEAWRKVGLDKFFRE